MCNTNETAVTGNWIKLFRNFQKWEWYKDSSTKDVFIDLLLEAQYEDGRYRGNEVKRGQLITSVDSIKTRTGLTTRQVRTALEHLESTGEIDKQSNTQFTLITICKYDSYQGGSFKSNQQNDKRPTNERQALKLDVERSSENCVFENDKRNDKRNDNIQEEKNIKNKELSTTTTGENFVQEENTFEEIPSEESKDYFTLKEVYDRLYSLYKEDTLDTAAKSFIKTKFFMIRSKGFTKKSGEIWDLLSFTNWLTKLLSEEGYSLPTPVFDIKQAKTFSPSNNVIPPFTKDDVRNCLKNEKVEVVSEILSKYDDFARNGFKTKSGNAVTLSFMTGYLKDEVKKSLGVNDNLPDYRKLNVANFWD